MKNLWFYVASIVPHKNRTNYEGNIGMNDRDKKTPMRSFLKEGCATVASLYLACLTYITEDKDILAFVNSEPDHEDGSLNLREEFGHISQVIASAIAVVNDEILHRPSELSEFLLRSGPSYGSGDRKDLADLNIQGAVAALQKFGTLENLRTHLFAQASEVQSLLEELTEEQFGMPITYRLVNGIGGSCAEFIGQMICIHGSIQYGKIEEQLRQMGFSLPSSRKASAHSSTIRN